jgi:hypothetical protein
VADVLAVRALADSSPDGGPVTGSVPVNGVLVTLLKPQVDAGAGVTVEPEGFFVQAAPSGPALFVAVSPSVNGVQPGDLVSFTVTAASRNATLRQATAYTGFSRTSAGNPVGPYAQSVSAIDLTVPTNLNDWESRLITMNASVTGSGAAAGTGYRAVNVSTMGTPDAGANLRLRLPGPLADTEDLQPGCAVSVTNGAMWRFNAAAQPSVYTAPQLMGSTCPAPTVLSARADSATSVVVSFDRNLAPATVQSGRFALAALDGGTTLNVSAASLTGPREATLTTNTMNGGAYQVTCNTMITDTRNTALSSTANTAQFNAFAAGQCSPGVIISQVYGGGGNSGAQFTSDFVELRNRTSFPVNVTGLSIQYQSSTGTTWAVGAAPTGTIPANGFFLVQLGPVGTNGVAIPTPDFVGATTVNLSGTTGKLALASGTAALPAGCPATGVIDLVSYGTSTVICAEGSPSAGLSNTTAATRANNGCTDTANNSVDISAGTPSPRNSASPAAAACTCP